MLPRIVRIICLFAYLLRALIAGPAKAQQPDTTIGDALRHLAVHAGTAFVGAIQTIEPPSPDHPSTVLITFQVTQPILGDPGPVYTLREWAGLWTMGRQRYTVGQRALFFLHPVNAAGLSSPVDGMEGILPLIPTSADAPPLLDIRRLTARILRSPTAPLASPATGAITLADASAILTHNAPSPGPEPTLRTLPGVAK